MTRLDQAQATRRYGWIALVALLTTVLAACGARGAAGSGDATSPGITDDTVVLGTSQPLSGPASAYSGVGKGMAAYFDSVNAAGGVKMADGKTRKIEFKSYDDAYQPDRALANARRLVQQDGVFALAGVFGTPGNKAMAGYIDEQQVPSIDVWSSSSEWRVPGKAHPWITSWGMTAEQEMQAISANILKNNPNAKVATIYQNDDSSIPAIAQLEQSLRGTGASLVAKETYEVTAPTVDSQVTNLAKSGADTVIWYCGPKQVVQAMQKAHELGWAPTMYVSTLNASIPNVMQPAGDAAKGALTSEYIRNPSDPAFAADPAVVEFKNVLRSYGNGLSADDRFAQFGVAVGQTVVAQLATLTKPTRQELIKVAKDSSLRLHVPLLLDGVNFNTVANDLASTGIKIQRYDGTKWTVLN